MSGIVTLDGKPAPRGLQVDFAPQVDRPSPSTGFTDDQGRYTMMFNTTKVGVLPGESIVRVCVPVSLGVEGTPVVPKQLKSVKLPDSAGAGSTLRKTVKRGHNEINIDIQSAPASKAAPGR